ncbi:hypothetical protein DV735_g4681, partial [Chaetothyriales sp. CBS 134920]
MVTVPYSLTGRGIDQLTDTDLEEYEAMYQEFADATLTSLDVFTDIFYTHLLPRFGGDLHSEAEEALMKLWSKDAASFIEDKIVQQKGYDEQIRELFAKAGKGDQDLSRKQLGYPLYAADFDPLNPDFLLVGGGGGSSSTGVPNKISLLDVSRPNDTAEITEIELAKDEDSVTTLAVASSSETSLTAIAGINSSVAEQESGRNNHLSARGPQNETYQRVLRSVPIQSATEPRVTAIASGLAPENEVISFQPVSNAVTSTVDEISRISLGKTEAADVDIIAVKGVGHVLAYCTDSDVYVQRLPGTKGSKVDAPVRVYQSPSPAPDSTAARKPQPKFRALRFLHPEHILLLQNRPGRTGASLLLLKLSTSTGSGHITLIKHLNSAIKLATGLDTAILRSPTSDDFQAIVAVASQDSSIELLTIDYTPSAGLSTFRPYALLREVVVVHTLTLRRSTAPSSPDKHKAAYFVLVPPRGSGALQTTISTFTALVVLLLAALLTQAFYEIRGLVPPRLGLANHLPADILDILGGQPAAAANVPIATALESLVTVSANHEATPDADALSPSSSPPPPASESLQAVLPLTDLLAEIAPSSEAPPTPSKVIVIRDTGDDLSAEVHHHDKNVKRWEELSVKEKTGWKEKLKSAGLWAEHHGEAVLQGIIFNQLAGVVGEALRN